MENKNYGKMLGNDIIIFNYYFKKLIKFVERRFVMCNLIIFFC